MKRTFSAALIVLLLLSLCLTACAEKTEPEIFTCGDYRYILLEDGTAEIRDCSDKSSILVIPETLDGHTVSKIGNHTFTEHGMSEIVIPDTVTEIGDEAFFVCRNLTSIVLPDSVVKVGVNPFISCYNLSEVTVSPDHPALEVVDGVLFSKQDQRLIYYPETKQAKAYQIPSGTLIIGENAFHSCENLTSIFIPDSVTVIEKNAFSGCSGLTAMTIPTSVIKVGANPFVYCYDLSEVTVSPEHPALEVIDGVLFSKGDHSLIYYPPWKQETAYEIPSGIETIGDSAFSNCSSLTSVSIPDSVTELGNRAFEFCYGLTDVFLPNSVVSIGDDAFLCCTHLSSISIPESVAFIGEGAFYQCTSLTNVIIPDHVTEISDNLFSTCHRLTSVSIPDSVTTIGHYAFHDCNHLTSLFIPDSVTFIGIRAFYDCKNLTLTVGRGSYAEQYCKEKGLNYTFPDSLD